MSELAEGNDDYSHAKKLVMRAAKREAALSNTDASRPDGMGSSIGADFSGLALKPDHIQRPCWTCPDGNIYLEAFHDLYLQAYDFLVAISEPLARPEFMHQYKLTPYSLYAAVATNIGTESIISVLERLSKNALPIQVKKFIRECTSKYGKAKLVLKHNKFYVESEYPEVLRELLRDPLIAQSRIQENVDENVDDNGFLTQKKAEEMKENLHMIDEPDDDSEDEIEENDKEKKPAVVVSFQIDGIKVENVKRQAIELDYPLMEEYDFKNDVS
jgi:DNA excision repair protein ERCC-3